MPAASSPSNFPTELLAEGDVFSALQAIGAKKPSALVHHVLGKVKIETEDQSESKQILGLVYSNREAIKLLLSKVSPYPVSAQGNLLKTLCTELHEALTDHCAFMAEVDTTQDEEAITEAVAEAHQIILGIFAAVANMPIEHSPVAPALPKTSLPPSPPKNVRKKNLSRTSR